MSSQDPRHQRILLIDDCDEDRARVRSALMEGAPMKRYHFREASDGVEGLKLIEANRDWPIDCVIVDLNMPRQGGLEMLQSLGDGRTMLDIPVIVLTGSTDGSEANHALQAGAQDFVSKEAIFPTVIARVVDNAIERHRLLKRVHASERAAEAANRAKSAMIGNISHEIRTPMTAVVGLADLLLQGELTEEQRTMANMILENGNYLVEIVNDLLDISKMEADMLPIEPEPVALVSFLQSLIELMGVRAFDNRIDLQLQLDHELPEVIMSDPVRLRQVLINLLGNAIKFSPGGKVTLAVATDEEANELKFNVHDTGCGIAPEHMQSIFRPFSQVATREGNKIEGTGLGLAICQRLTTAMGGNLGVESCIGQGSTFTVTLPLEEVADVFKPEKSRESPANETEEVTLAGKQILVAEDTRATQFLLRKMIEMAEGRVTMVVDGQELLERFMAEPRRYAALITDVHMPKIDGLTALRQIREVDSKIPAFVLTADAQSETRKFALDAGATGIITKPIDRTELLRSLALVQAADHG